LRAELPAAVRAADEAALSGELRDLFGQSLDGPRLRVMAAWDATTAEDAFLSRLAPLGAIDGQSIGRP
jgi:hypothetical protein